MKNNLIFCLLLTAMLFGCKNELPDTPAESLENQQLAQIETVVNAAFAEIDAAYANEIYPATGELSSRATVTVPAGSVNALAAAIQQAGYGGTVIVASGDHWESGTLTISTPVRLKGEDGARIYFNVAEPGSVFPFNILNVLDPAIYIKRTYPVWIENLSIRPTSGKGSTGIFVERGLRTRIKNNDITNFQFGVWLSENSQFAEIYDNNISGPDGNKGVWGIVSESGKYVKIKGNHVDHYAACIFASDENGTMVENETVGGSMGPLLCTVQGNVQLPNGEMLQNAVPCKDWVVGKNVGRNSVWNYVIIDGANDNFIYRNESYDPVFQDIILLGDSYLTGIFTPLTHNNFVVNLAGIETKDCGVNNVVLGGTMTDTNLDPCF